MKYGRNTSTVLLHVACLGVLSLPLHSLGVEDGWRTNDVSSLNVARSLQAGHGTFLVDTNGDISLIKGVSYAWPSDHNTTNSVLVNDGNGNLAWVQNTGVVPFLAPNADVAWNSQPSALTEFLGSTRNRTQVDLSAIMQVRLTVNVLAAGSASPVPVKIQAQYSLDQATWRYFDAAQANPSVNIDTTGLKTSAWVDIESGARTNVFIRIVGLNGKNNPIPSFGMITLQIR